MLDIMRDAVANVYIQHAVDPLTARQLSLSMGGPGDVVTFEDVEETFGWLAAMEWHKCKVATKQFFKLIRTEDPKPSSSSYDTGQGDEIPYDTGQD